MLGEIIEARKKKLDLLKKAGLNPYPAKVKVSHRIKEALADFGTLIRSRRKICLAGRVMSLRDLGALMFFDVYDGSARLQTVLNKKNFKEKEFNFWKSVLDIGDFVEVGGPLFKTKTGEKSIEAKSLRLIAKSLRPLPSAWYGLEDIEERFRKRYLDILFNAEVKKEILLRSEMVRFLRERLWQEGFIEVETPILQPIPGGALARPFETHHQALDEDFYLRIAPELYLKRLLVAGFDKVFEIGRVFRNEGLDREHNPEFTMLELYWAYEDYEGLMKFTGKLLKKFIPGPWQKITYAEALKKYAGRELTQLDPEKIDEVFKKEVRPKIKKPTIVSGYPKAISPLAKSSEKDQEVTDRFQLIVEGMEIVNAFSELNDPLDQRERMERQEELYRKGDSEVSRLDEDYLEALEYGMPPAAGLGLGIDRLVALVTGKSVKESIIFPTLRSK
jgi:lysyl-tRNA synthetase class 2